MTVVVGPSPIGCLLLSALCFQTLIFSEAFEPQIYYSDAHHRLSTTTTRASSTTTIRTRSSTELWSTTPGDADDGNLDDDEISKLIGKRNQIRRKKKEEQQQEVELKLPDDVVSFDLEGLPEFKSKRPVRQSKERDVKDATGPTARQRGENANAGGGGAGAGDDEIVSIDYCAEYADENDLHIPNRLGFSTSGWGDPTRGFVDEGKLTKRMIKAGRYVPGDCQMVYNKLLQGGISLVETSSVYGKASRKHNLSAEEILAQCVAEYSADAALPIIIESLPSSWIPPLPKVVTSSVEKSCQRLKIDAVDIVQASKRVPLLSRVLASGLLRVAEAGSCNYVGVVGILQRRSLRRFADRVESGGGTLTSNAFEFSLTNLKNEQMIGHCKELGVIPLVLDPLDGGLASGVYTATNPSGGNAAAAAKFPFKRLEKLQPLHGVLETVAQRAQTRVARELRDLEQRTRSKYGPPPKINTDITTTQIAINYVIAKGGVPLPEINTPKEADELLGCLGWSLTDDEVDMLDSAATLCQL